MRSIMLVIWMLGATGVMLEGCAAHGGRDLGTGPEVVVREGLTLIDVNSMVDGDRRIVEYQPVSMQHGFDEALVSFNLDIEAGAWAVAEVGVGRHAEVGRPEFWSPWMRLAAWGNGPVDLAALHEFADASTGLAGKIDVDYFRAAPGSKFDGLRYRVRTSDRGVRVRRVGVCTTDERGWVPRELGWRPARAIALDVPFRSQKTPDASLSGRLCSPTSVAMVLAYRGVDVPVNEVAKRSYDAHEDIYGNWPRNVQAAYELGVPGYLTRFARWSDVERCFAAGQPLIVSVIAGPGELRNAPYAKTSGHLIVLRGFDERGRVLANDPAAGDSASGMRAYERADLTNVWMYRTGGTAYVLMERQSKCGLCEGDRR